MSCGVGGHPGMRMSTGSTSSSAPGELGRIAEDAAAERAVAQRGDQPRLGHRVVGDRSSAVAMRVVTGPVTSRTSAWRGEATMSEAEALQVVERARREAELVLAAVARAGVDVAQGERAPRVARARRPALTADAGELAQEDEHQRSTQA